ncbi:MAG: TerB N-terminal domain-containing protein, partial [Eubacteriales bacterium]|nr:TerB N-terminal domain-containing protein [Eubacteriales bacterium]
NTGSLLAARKGQGEEQIPERIRGMKRLYKYGSGTFKEKCMNFYIQGKYMEDYEDNVPWRGDFFRYFPTYHELNNNQLRGYFTWRAGVRRGVFEKVPASVVYIYIYELLNGIGVSSPEESLQKLKEFEEGYFGSEGSERSVGTETGKPEEDFSGTGKAGFLQRGGSDPGIRKSGIRTNMHRWMLEYAVIQGVAPETARLFLDPELVRKDRSLEILREPLKFGDRDVFDALCFFAGNKIVSSPVVKKTEEGIHLIAETWRYACAHYSADDRELFRRLFGELFTLRRRPLENVVYAEKKLSGPVNYVLNPCRKYTFDGAVWREHSYQNIYFNKKKLTEFLHETERQLRLYLKAGGRLKQVPDEDWAAPYAQAVIEADRAAKLEAAKPKVTIRFSELEQIRRDALETRDSLLTEEERRELQQEAAAAPQCWIETGTDLSIDSMPENVENAGTDSGRKTPADPLTNSVPENGRNAGTDSGRKTSGDPSTASGIVSGIALRFDLPEEPGTVAQTDFGQDKTNNPPVGNCIEGNGTEKEGKEKEGIEPETVFSAPPLDAFQMEILGAVLRGESVRERIAARHGMAEVIADSLNEALFDEIGDNAMECEDGEIFPVEDYREDLLELLQKR